MLIMVDLHLTKGNHLDQLDPPSLGLMTEDRPMVLKDDPHMGSLINLRIIGRKDDLTRLMCGRPTVVNSDHHTVYQLGHLLKVTGHLVGVIDLRPSETYDHLMTGKEGTLMGGKTTELHLK